MVIREANLNDLDSIMDIYQLAKHYMRANHNPTQWKDGYPQRELLIEDIRKHECFVLCSEHGELHGVFVFIIGEDPTYSYIENGSWRNEEAYGTIHRIASDGKIHGVTKHCINFCKDKMANLRADTHHDNKIMQHAFESNGFLQCGIIYIADGSPRIAYHYIRN